MTAVTFGQPVTATYGSADPAAPLVVLLHGRGSNEREILSLAPHLPGDVAYAAVRAPLAEGSGFAWFANRGIGRPVAASLAVSMKWFRSWLDSVAPIGRRWVGSQPDRPVPWRQPLPPNTHRATSHRPRQHAPAPVGARAHPKQTGEAYP